MELDKFKTKHRVTLTGLNCLAVMFGCIWKLDFTKFVNFMYELHATFSSCRDMIISKQIQYKWVLFPVKLSLLHKGHLEVDLNLI